MALHLNLLHEIESAKRARQRDPLKLGIYALVFILLCFLGFYLLRLGATGKILAEQKALENEWAELQPKQAAAVTRAEELRAEIALSTNAIDFIESRFYWAPLLENIGQIVPASVQINRISADLQNTRDCTISLEGIAAGAQPRTVAETLRTALAENLLGGKGRVDSTFVSLEDGTTQALMGGKALPTAVFTIRLSVSLPAEPAPAP